MTGHALALAALIAGTPIEAALIALYVRTSFTEGRAQENEEQTA